MLLQAHDEKLDRRLEICAIFCDTDYQFILSLRTRAVRKDWTADLLPMRPAVPFQPRLNEVAPATGIPRDHH
jgi:hypothetical protein